MIKRFGDFVALALVVSLAGGACDDGSAPSGIGNDAQPTVVSGGGTTGGAIDGRINVYAFDDKNDTPLVDAFVMLGPGPDPQFSGKTDADGLVSFRSNRILGPQQITVYKAGYPLNTMVGLNAANLTVSMNEAEEEELPDPDTATVTGTVTGFDQIAEPGANQFKIAFVAFSTPDLFTEEETKDIEQPDVEPAGNLVAPSLPKDDYSLVTRVGRQAIYAIGGLLTQDPGGGDPEIEMTHFGMLSNVTTTKGQTLADQDIALTIALDKPAKIAIDPLTPGSDSAMVLPLLDLGDDGQIMIGSITDEDEDNVFEGNIPGLAGALADASFHLVARVYKQVCEGSGQDEECTDEPPASMVIRRDVTDADLEDVTLDDLLAPVSNLKAETNDWSFSFTAPADADAISADLSVEDAVEETETRLFSAIFFDADVSGFSLPELPTEAGFPGLGGDDLIWDMGGLRFEAGTDPSSIRFEDFGQFVTHMSEAEKIVSQ